MSPCELSMRVTALANAIACQLSDDDLEVAAVVFSQLGDTLATISVQRFRCNKRTDAGQKCKGQDDTDTENT